MPPPTPSHTCRQPALGVHTISVGGPPSPSRCRTAVIRVTRWASLHAFRARRGPPGNEPVRHGINVIASRVEPEMVFKFKQQVLADLGSVCAGFQPCE